jgi:hypothetical protein
LIRPLNNKVRWQLANQAHTLPGVLSKLFRDTNLKEGTKKSPNKADANVRGLEIY